MKEISKWAEVAKNIRKDLKQHFPNVKFSVTSAAYAGGTSVYINYSDNNLKAEEVNKIVDKYEAGWFDGMSDCYMYYEDRDYPTVRFVIVSNLA